MEAVKKLSVTGKFFVLPSRGEIHDKPVPNQAPRSFFDQSGKKLVEKTDLNWQFSARCRGGAARGTCRRELFLILRPTPTVNIS